MTLRDAAVVSIFIGTIVAGFTWILMSLLDNILALKKSAGQEKDAQAPPPES